MCRDVDTRTGGQFASVPWGTAPTCALRHLYAGRPVMGPGNHRRLAMETAKEIRSLSDADLEEVGGGGNVIVSTEDLRRIETQERFKDALFFSLGRRAV
jgi:hypothetical protein